MRTSNDHCDKPLVPDQAPAVRRARLLLRRQVHFERSQVARCVKAVMNRTPFMRDSVQVVTLAGFSAPC